MLRLLQCHRKTKHSVAVMMNLGYLRGETRGHFNFNSTLTSDPSKKNLYEILDIKNTATTSEIREAFLRLSKECHPDVTNSDPENHQKFVKLNEAYSVLSKPLSRRDYDLSLWGKRYQGTQTFYHSHGYPQNHFYRGGMSTPSSGDFEGSKRWIKTLVNYTYLLSFLTIGITIYIFVNMESLVPDVTKQIANQDKRQGEFIMASAYNGRHLHYYAVPDKEDPSKYEIVARDPELDSKK